MVDANHANTRALEAPPSVSGAAVHLHLKRHTQKLCFLLTLKKWQF